MIASISGRLCGASLAALLLATAAAAEPGVKVVAAPAPATTGPVGPSPRSSNGQPAAAAAAKVRRAREPSPSERARLAVLRKARERALALPQKGAFVGAALFYDYELGRLYRIDSSPRFLTTIALRPGEHLVSKAAGDTVRWILGETTQGVGDQAQTLVLVKPVRGDLHTNLVLTTDQRTYFIEAVSHEDPVFTSILSWNYPMDQLREAQASAARAAALQAVKEASVVQHGLAVESLNFGYRIDHPHAKRGPAWEPVRVFDDGAKTYLQFSPTMKVTDAPPLFLMGRKGAAELVNYRVSGAYYVVDRLFDAAELRLGETPQEVVRITRVGGTA